MRCPRCSFDNTTGARFCQQCGNPLAEQEGQFQGSLQPIGVGKQPVAGERKPVAILFTDIAGSTAIAEKLDPEEWKEILSGAQRIVATAVRRYEGTIAQFLGDGVLAFFGAPLTHEDDSQRAIRAALEIRSEVEGYRRSLAGMVPDFQMRIGIHIGTVVVGQVGDDQHREFLAVGDAVNVAARLQSAARPGGILVSEVVARLVRSEFALIDLGEIQVKGKGQPLHVFEVEKSLLSTGTVRRSSGISSPLIGRDKERALILDRVRRLEQGHGGIVFILGEAGIGKSRLVEEARQAAGPDTRWLEGRCLSYGAALSFWAVIQIILEDLNLSEGEPAPRIRVAVQRKMNALFPGRVEEFAPYLLHLLGLRQDDETAERLARLSPEALKRQVLVAITAYFSALAERGPLVLVFEDIHWADASTLEALERLFAITGRLPLLMICLARPERGHASWRIKQDASLDFPEDFTEIHLQPLTPAETEDLVGELVDSTALPAPVRQQIVAQGDGNPFYIEEILANLIDQGVLRGGEDGWQVTRKIEQIEIPDTLQGVLLARIDSLSEDVRQTLQLASVIGRSFHFRILEAISAAELELDWHLAQLQRADLIREFARMPELEYIFKHSLTQEAAYRSLLLERRQKFHHLVGEALMRLFPDRLGEFSALLAHHYDLAGEPEKAISYLLKAGDKARLEYALEEARQMYRRAIELLEKSGNNERLANTWLKLGLVHLTEFAFDEAHNAYEQAFALQRQRQIKEEAQKDVFHSDAPPKVLRIGERTVRSFEFNLDEEVTFEGEITSSLFAGLVEYDQDTNIVPHVARSWEVLEEGRRYVFHLRDDVYWSDGTQVTAADFEWAWKYKLVPGNPEMPASLLDDIAGAQSFRRDQNSDPTSVRVNAIDPLTLSVYLETPAPYFIYLAANPVTHPMPRRLVEQYGADWWKPPHGVYNGPFRLVQFSAAGLRMERNHRYFGSFPGNIDAIAIDFIRAQDPEPVERFQQSQLDMIKPYRLWEPDHHLPLELQHERRGLMTTVVVMNPQLPPLNDIRVRQALACGLDYDRLAEIMVNPGVERRGGFVPPGMAGYSPELGLPFDLPLARRLLAEAGYPGGSGIPALKFGFFIANPALDAMVNQIQENLGIQCDVIIAPFHSQQRSLENNNITIVIWGADYPDPDNFLRGFVDDILRQSGWRHERYDSLIDEARQCMDQKRRLELYRQADRILVNEEVILIPLGYGQKRGVDLIQPWVHGYESDALMNMHYKCIRLDERSSQILSNPGSE